MRRVAQLGIACWLFLFLLPHVGIAQATDPFAADTLLPVGSEPLPPEEPLPLKEAEEQSAVPVEDEFRSRETDATGDTEQVIGELPVVELPAIVKPLNKIGGGVTLISYFAGITGFYDHTLNRETGSLLHTRLIIDATSVSSEGTSLSINRTFINANYRIPLTIFRNSYGGVGLGYGTAALVYKNTQTGKTYSASGGGLFLTGNLGWEKYWNWTANRQIFLVISFSIGSYLAYNDDYDETQISNQTNHRDIVNAGWAEAQQVNHFLVGFGGTF